MLKAPGQPDPGARVCRARADGYASGKPYLVAKIERISATSTALIVLLRSAPVNDDRFED